MTTKELKTLLTLLRDKGVLKYQTTELTLELSEVIPRDDTPSEDTQMPVEKTWEEMTEEERMFYSADKPITNVSDQ